MGSFRLQTSLIEGKIVTYIGRETLFLAAIQNEVTSKAIVIVLVNV
jgi:hypothetical protein